MNVKNYYQCCAVPCCVSSTIKTPRKLFIHVPAKTDIRNKWLERARVNVRDVSQKSNLFFCEDHFDLENDMENYKRYKIMGSVQQIQMRPQCVPSRFDCQATSDPWIVNRLKKSKIKKMDENLDQDNEEISSRPPNRKQAAKPAMLAPSTAYTGFQETYIQSLLNTLDFKTPEPSKKEINNVPINKTKSACHRPNRRVPIMKKDRKKISKGFIPNVLRRYNVETINLKLTEQFKGIFYEILKVLTVDTNTIAITDLVRAVKENQSLRAEHKSEFTWDDDIYEILEQTCDYECIEKNGVYYAVIYGFNIPDCGAEIEAPHLKDDVECELQMKIELEEETFTPGTNTNVQAMDSRHLPSIDSVKVEMEEDTGPNTNFTSFDSYLPYADDCMVKIEEGELPDLLDDESSLPARRNNEKPNPLSLPANGDVPTSRLRPVYCFVPECPSNSKEFPNKLYFNVPFIGPLREKWLKVVGRDTDTAHLSLKCCSDHFDLEKDTECWKRNKNLGEDIKIKKGVLPHKFLCQQRTTIPPVPSCVEVDKSTDAEAYYRRRYNESCFMSCFAPFCKSNSKECPDKIFFVLPEHKKLRKKWTNAIGRDPLYMKSKSRGILTCCSDHFDLSKDIQEPVRKNVRRYPKLKKGVIPHKFQRRHRIRPGIKKIEQGKKKSAVQRELKEILKPVADDINMAEYTGSSDTASERSLDNRFSSDDEKFDKTCPDEEPTLCQCSSCSEYISDVRYRCLQCSWWLCAGCEARGLHAQHCVVRAPGHSVSLDLVEIRLMMRNLKRILQNKSVNDTDDWRINAVDDDGKSDTRVNDVPTVTTTEFYNGFQDDIPYDYEEVITSDQTVFNESSMTLQPHRIGTQPTIKIPLTNAFTKETEQIIKRPQLHILPIAGKSSAEENTKKGPAQSTGQNKELVFNPPQVLISNPRRFTPKTSTVTPRSLTNLTSKTMVTQNETFLKVTSGPAKSSNKIVSSKASPAILDTPQSFATFLDKNKEYRVVPTLSAEGTIRLSSVAVVENITEHE